MPRAKRHRSTPNRQLTGHWLGYVRVSTGKQALSVERQMTVIEAEADRRGVQVQVLTDNGISGTLPPARRPGLAYVLSLLDQGEADGLIVAKLDRLGRHAADLTTLIDLATTQGWTLVVLDPAMDLGTWQGRGMAHMLAAVAEMEAEMVAERTAAIVEMKREQGKSLGGRPAAVPQAIVDRIERERGAGRTWQAIADGLEADGIATGQGGTRWRPSSVSSVLKRAARELPAPGRTALERESRRP